MSSKKRPLRDITNPPIQDAPRTPRYAPSTPHAIRALQQRSGAQRSTRANKTATLARPDSARGILRRLAKITAPTTRRRVSTPVGIGKENVPASSGKKRDGGRATLEDEEDEDNDEDERPNFSLPMVEEDDDSELLGEAPMPSSLPGGEYRDPTVTFRNVASVQARLSMSERPETRNVSRLSGVSVRNDQPGEDEDDDDGDREIEIGRRAVSEGPLDRYPRSSFGSIRMSDFGMGEQNRRSSGNDLLGKEKTPGLGVGHEEDYNYEIGIGDEYEVEIGNETEDFRRHRKSLSAPYDPGAEAESVHDQTFRLDLPAQQSPYEPSSPGIESVHSGLDSAGEDNAEAEEGPASPGPQSSPSQNRTMTAIEAAAAARAPRRKKVKLTKHGIAIPTLPSSLIKRLAIESMTKRGKRKPTIDRASMKALEQATEWFFEQVGEDLEAYSNHAGRKKRIDASDVLTLMRRQRVLKEPNALREAAREYLPPDARLELDLPKEL